MAATASMASPALTYRGARPVMPGSTAPRPSPSPVYRSVHIQNGPPSARPNIRTGSPVVLNRPLPSPMAQHRQVPSHMPHRDSLMPHSSSDLGMPWRGVYVPTPPPAGARDGNIMTSAPRLLYRAVGAGAAPSTSGPHWEATEQMTLGTLGYPVTARGRAPSGYATTSPSAGVRCHSAGATCRMQSPLGFRPVTTGTASCKAGPPLSASVRSIPVPVTAVTPDMASAAAKAANAAAVAAAAGRREKTEGSILMHSGAYTQTSLNPKPQVVPTGSEHSTVIRRIDHASLLEENRQLRLRVETLEGWSKTAGEDQLQQTYRTDSATTVGSPSLDSTTKEMNHLRDITNSMQSHSHLDDARGSGRGSVCSHSALIVHDTGLRELQELRSTQAQLKDKVGLLERMLQEKENAVNEQKRTIWTLEQELAQVLNIDRLQAPGDFLRLQQENKSQLAELLRENDELKMKLHDLEFQATIQEGHCVRAI